MRSVVCLGVAAWFSAIAAVALAPAALASPPQTDRVLAAQTSLTLGLIRHLESEPGGNVVLSPASLAAVLSLLDIGSDATMRAALQRVLGFGAQADGTPQSDLANLRSVVAGLKSGVDDKSVSFSMANAFEFDPKAHPYPAAMERLRVSGAEVEVDDLNNPAALKHINDWVAIKTRNLIPSIIDVAPPHPGLVALNALYFKGLWLSPFDKAQTSQMPFQSVDGSRTDAAMMHTETVLGVRKEGRFVAVDLAYQGERFALAVVTTVDRPARAAEFAATESWLRAAGFHSEDVYLSLPRFTLDENAELLPALDALGLKNARASPTAFSGLAAGRLDLSAVAQRTHLGVDEQGTEAAAVTGGVFGLASAHSVVAAKFDKPFVFALRDQKTGLILLSGYVGHPKSEATASR